MFETTVTIWAYAVATYPFVVLPFFVWDKLMELNNGS